jgi:hypothetical protein
MTKKKLVFTGLLLFFLFDTVLADENVLSVDELRKTASAYENGREGLRKDYKQAFALYCKAALKGDSESAYSLGFMYFYGRGFTRDLSLAVRWFKQAADAGDRQAAKMLERFHDVALSDDPLCKPEVLSIKLMENSNPDRKIVQGWVEKIAPIYGIDPLLVMAVIQAESAFNAKARSGKNAQGLMQLIPETAERFGVKDSWNPVQNIKGGTAYLHWLMRRFEGKVDWVLAAYNAGEGVVERYKGIPPYPETQNYVKHIQDNYKKPMHPIPPESPVKLLMLEQES